MSSVKSVVLAGGGTGGHIYPLLAFADCLRRHDPDLRITCIGSPRGLESELIPPHGYELRHVPAHQLPRKVNLDLAKTPLRMWRSMHAARKVLDDVAADVVVGFGGYVAVPAYLAAWRRRTPIVIHEVNVPPGVANRLGMRFTDNVAVGFPHQPAQSPDLGTAEVVGVPLRRSIATLERVARREEARKRFELEPDLPTLLVFGASQGARTINQAIAGAATSVTEAGVQVLHLMGARNDPVQIPENLSVPYRTLTYLDEMELAYAAADLALCRSGAMTCAELAAVGLPAAYVPYPHSNREQYRNASPVVDAGGGLLVDDSELTAEWIEKNLVPLALDRQRLARMSKAAATYGRRDGDEALRAFMLEAVTGEPVATLGAVAAANAAAESVAGLSAATGTQPDTEAGQAPADPEPPATEPESPVTESALPFGPIAESEPPPKREGFEPDSYPGSLFEPVRQTVAADGGRVDEGRPAAEDSTATADTVDGPASDTDVVVADAAEVDADPEPATEGDAGPAPAAEGDADPVPAAEADADPEPAAEGDADPVPAAEADPTSDDDPVAEAETDHAAKGESVSATGADEPAPDGRTGAAR